MGNSARSSVISAFCAENSGPILRTQLFEYYIVEGLLVMMYYKMAG